jgi:mono/diheme cytochrome c family protein
MRKPICLLFGSLLLAAFSSCGSRELHVPAPATFASIEALTIGPKCTQCHQSLSTYYGVLRIVTPGDPANSPLFQQVNSGDMPKQSTKLSDPEIAAISSWIKNGAPQ